MLLSWQGTGEDIVVFYKVYRRQIHTDQWDLIGTVPVAGDNQGGYEFRDVTIASAPSAFEYAVSAQDHYGNESPLSEITCVGSVDIFSATR